MVRLTVELELPEEDVDELRVALSALCLASEGWKLMGVHKSTDALCPQCGAPMEWDRDFAGYVCHHPA